MILDYDYSSDHKDFDEVWSGFMNNKPYPLPDQPSVAVWQFWRICSGKYRLKLNIAYTIIFILVLFNIYLLFK